MPERGRNTLVLKDLLKSCYHLGGARIEFGFCDLIVADEIDMGKVLRQPGSQGLRIGKGIIDPGQHDVFEKDLAARELDIVLNSRLQLGQRIGIIDRDERTAHLGIYRVK